MNRMRAVVYLPWLWGFVSLILWVRPAVGGHELTPTPVELAMVAVAVTEVAGPGLKLFVKAFVAQSLHVVQLAAAGDHSSGGLADEPTQSR